MKTQHSFELIAKPCADLGTLCSLALTSTNRKISVDADNHVPKLSADKKLAACLNTFIEHAPMSHGPVVGSHLWFSGFLVVEEYVVADVMMTASELACMHAETKARGLTAMILSGNLNAWKSAIEAGLGDTVELFQIFTTIKNAFDVAGYGGTNRVGGGLIRG